MRSLLIADVDLAVREAALLHRLVIGLLDAGVHVTLAAPLSVLDRIEPALGVEILPYRLRGGLWTRSIRVRDLLDRFRDATSLSEGDEGLVHAFGGACLGFASELASQAGYGLVLDLHARRDVERAVDIASQHERRMLLAGSAPLARAAIAAGAEASAVRERAWGVTVSARARPVPGEGMATTLALGGPGRAPRAWEAALRGIAKVASRHEQLNVFVDADGAASAGTGRLVGSLGLTPILSRVPDFEARRQLVVQADILLWPERLGEIRSVVHDAMAQGSAVIAAQDAISPALASPAHAALVSDDPDDWSEAIEALVADPSRRLELGERAAAYTAEHHKASAHISGILDAYEWCIGQGSIRIGHEP
ncbi:MAG: glycosyltransferase [Planctomycetota bacterium]